MLRAILWWKTGEMERATRIASKVGQAVGLLFIVWGIAQFFGGAGVGGLWISFIGWFLLQAAGESYVQVGLAHTFEGVTAGDVMTSDCPAPAASAHPIPAQQVPPQRTRRHRTHRAKPTGSRPRHTRSAHPLCPCHPVHPRGLQIHRKCERRAQPRHRPEDEQAAGSPRNPLSRERPSSRGLRMKRNRARRCKREPRPAVHRQIDLVLIVPRNRLPDEVKYRALHVHISSDELLSQPTAGASLSGSAPPSIAILRMRAHASGEAATATTAVIPTAR